eukprot:scaffold13150_cov125-Isochrysis_galbana.AAC.1
MNLLPTEHPGSEAQKPLLLRLFLCFGGGCGARAEVMERPGPKRTSSDVPAPARDAAASCVARPSRTCELLHSSHRRLSRETDASTSGASAADGAAPAAGWSGAPGACGSAGAGAASAWASASVALPSSALISSAVGRSTPEK